MFLFLFGGGVGGGGYPLENKQGGEGVPLGR